MQTNRMVTSLEEGIRLDSVLPVWMEQESKEGERYSRSHIQEWIGQGLVQVNSHVTTKGALKLKAGDRVEWKIPRPENIDLTPVNMHLTVLYEDAYLAVIIKPNGLTVHPGAGVRSGTLVQGLLHQLVDLSGINGKLRPGIVHRLDRETEGLMVIAKNDQAHIGLSEQFAAHSLTKRYRALVWGEIKPVQAVLHSRIARDNHNRVKMKIVYTGGKEIKTGYKRILTIQTPSGMAISYLKIDLFTGRTHQIRAQMTHLHHPVVGDTLYGRKSEFKEQGMFLQSYYLSFIHPVFQREMSFRLPLPERFKNLLRITKF